MKTEEYLKVVQDKITGHWTQGTLFRDAQNAVTLKQSEAFKFCVLGAFLITESLVDKRTREKAFSVFISAAGSSQLDKWNDNKKMTHLEVISTFEKAREIAKEEK